MAEPRPVEIVVRLQDQATAQLRVLAQSLTAFGRTVQTQAQQAAQAQMQQARLAAQEQLQQARLAAVPWPERPTKPGPPHTTRGRPGVPARGGAATPEGRPTARYYGVIPAGGTA